MNNYLYVNRYLSGNIESELCVHALFRMTDFALLWVYAIRIISELSNLSQHESIHTW